MIFGDLIHVMRKMTPISDLFPSLCERICLSTCIYIYILSDLLVMHSDLFVTY